MSIQITRTIDDVHTSVFMGCQTLYEGTGGTRSYTTIRINENLRLVVVWSQKPRL